MSSYRDGRVVKNLPIFHQGEVLHPAKFQQTFPYECTKRGGKVWIKIFPDKPITEKPAETRMGSGKGSPEYWVAVVKPGRVMFEIAGVNEEVAREALRLASHKLPVKCKIVKREELEAQEVGE